ncbi:hypothetical protein GGS26DRAFT_596688 [Hypomontagnella submonticulosa]|nr:hypothetical protein GGS26DRAFT_596688 [Hypomontagnella submonticulosa]
MASAMEKALSIFEILEMILLRVHRHDVLFNVQRVSKSWKAVVEDSIRLQCKLYFKAIPTSIADLPDSVPRFAKNPLALRSIPFFFQTLYKGGIFSPKAKYSPFVACELKPNMGYELRWCGENASWRRMHIAQPPITKVHWVITQVYSVRDSWPSIPGMLARFEFPMGLRLGEFFDMIYGTGGARDVKWPYRRKCDNPNLAPKTDKFYPSKWGQWFEGRETDASVECAIFIEQDVYDYPVGVDGTVPDPLHLQQYHCNLRSLETTRIPYDRSGETLVELIPMDSYNAMHEFLRAALRPAASP